MQQGYSTRTIRDLERMFTQTAVHRPMRRQRYEAGTELVYDVTGMGEAVPGRVRLLIEKFVGGGFAGQVYRVRVLESDSPSGPIEGLEAGNICAMKILIPPSGFSRIFRDILYAIGFQGPFQLQVNPAAARAGALWQKFFRRGAGIRFGTERSVVDIYATFVDGTLGSCGELSEWVEGRTWRLEVDERMDLLKLWIKGKDVDPGDLGSPEYRAKREFMRRFVDLLHDMGGYEFARQYEWSTCKSQPNCLKRTCAESSPADGLTAVDFRAGLALLPFLPMSPGDFILIGRGLKRGSLVQFDRGDTKKLERFIDENDPVFSDMRPMMEELKEVESIYRDSVPDITHNFPRIFGSRNLWSTILRNSITGWRVRNTIDDRSEEKLRGSPLYTLSFYLLGIIPFLGGFSRKLLGRPDWRMHYRGMLTSMNYMRRAIRAYAVEKVISWHRSGRLDERHAVTAAEKIWPVFYHLPLSVLPAALHRFITDRRYAREKLAYIFIRPVRLYFDARLREEWLRDMVSEGKKDNLLMEEDAEIILSRIKEPFIQKYLKSLAVHVCTLPVTQIVSVTAAVAYVLLHPEMSRAQAWGTGLGIIALFQVTPISPGSLVRGFYVLYLVIRERNFRDYNIAVFLGFFKYIGYLAFPIQMGYRYPELARFMAAHWATDAVHIVPVFGERGALLEHSVFGWFYNWPLTMRRRMRKRREARALASPRYWHIIPCIGLGLLLFVAVDVFSIRNSGSLAGIQDIWWLAILIPFACGIAVTLGAGGATLSNRIIGAASCGASIGLLSVIIPAFAGSADPIGPGEIGVTGLWRIFIFTIFSTLGLILTELKLPDPELRRRV